MRLEQKDNAMSTDTQNNNELFKHVGDTASTATDGPVSLLGGVPGALVTNIDTSDPTNIMVSFVGTTDPSKIPMPDFSMNPANKKHMASLESHIEKALAPPKPGTKPFALKPVERVRLGQILNAVRSGKATNHTFMLLVDLAGKYPGLIPQQTIEAIRPTARPRNPQMERNEPKNIYFDKNANSAQDLANLVQGKDKTDRLRSAKTEQLGDGKKNKHDYTDIKVNAAYLTPLYADQLNDDQPKPSAGSTKPEDEAKEGTAQNKLQTADENGALHPRSQWYGTAYAMAMAPHPSDG